MRDDFRMFRTDRMGGAEATGESFRPRRVALLRDYVERLKARRGRPATDI